MEKIIEIELKEGKNILNDCYMQPLGVYEDNESNIKLSVLINDKKPCREVEFHVISTGELPKISSSSKLGRIAFVKSKKEDKLFHIFEKIEEQNIAQPRDLPNNIPFAPNMMPRDIFKRR